MSEAMYDELDDDDDYDYDEDYEHDDLDDWASDHCYECTGYGDDYFINDEGELECYCPYCYANPNRQDWDDEDD